MSGRPYELDVLSDEVIGRAGGFLSLRRLRLRNVRPDGSHSREWLCDFIEREKGLDAVVLVLWRRTPSGNVEVLLRDGLRPALWYGRAPERSVLPDARRYFLLTEVVAGIVEEGEVGHAALVERAVAEGWEEAGYRVAPASVELLGAGCFPSPGMTPEKFYITAARVEGEGAAPVGDGSPMEEGASVRWMDLDTAIAACVRGDLPDMKTELALRRLRDHLS